MATPPESPSGPFKIQVQITFSSGLVKTWWVVSDTENPTLPESGWWWMWRSVSGEVGDFRKGRVNMAHVADVEIVAGPVPF